MKRNRIMIAGTGIAAVGLAVFAAFMVSKNETSRYRFSDHKVEMEGEAANEAQSAKGAAQWWFDRVKNVTTGQLDVEEMNRIQQLANQSYSNARNSSVSAASVSWNEIGPDNVGGRTRALVIDRNNSNHMFAGAVSGGLWESFDGGNNWQRNASYFSTPGVNLNIATIAQASNGDWYVGTGEGMYYFFGTGAGGFIGNGIYKSTDNGATWTYLTSTAPSSSNNAGVLWAAVNKIAIDPNDYTHIFASTNKGLRVSTDGGNTWVTPAGLPANAESSDVDVPGNGVVICTANGKPYRSSDNGATFVNVGTSANGFFSGSLSRTEIDFAPSDANYVYAFCATTSGTTAGAYVSTDGGQTWGQIAGSGNAQFEPFGTGQGDYDNVVEVDPSDKNRAIFGGVELWEFNLIQTAPAAGQWTRIAFEFPNSPFNPWYVHSDKHAITFHPSQPNTFFIGTDGGVFRTVNNGSTYQAMNNGYNVTQAYAVAFDHVSGSKNVAIIGCQDNGTQFVDGNGNTAMSSVQVNGGDGGNCEISILNPSAVFSTVYYGSLARSNNRGQSSSDFYSSRISGISTFGNPGFAAFVTPIRLWESFNDPLSSDSIMLVNGQITRNEDVTDGSTATFTGTLSSTSPLANPLPTVDLASVMFVCGPDTAVSNGAGTISGDATGTVQTNGQYSITFNTTPSANRVLKSFFNVQYGAGTVLTMNSNVQGRQFYYTLTNALASNDTVKIQDPVQARLAVGFTGNNGIWITKRPLDFSITPEWIKIGGSKSVPSVYSGEASCLAWSPDGNYLFVGTAGGNVYRFSNISAVVDSSNGDSEANGGSIANPNCVVTCHLIGSFGSRAVTAIDVHPNNPDMVLVTCGNYSQTQYVYMSTTGTTATTSTGTFANKTGNLVSLGGVPVLACSFDKYNASRALIGTEHGMFETSNINATSPTWVDANTNLDPVCVDMIRQQRFEPWHVPNAGCFYIGTHGRGIWRDDSSWQQPTSIGNPNTPASPSNTGINNDLKVFPNPVVNNSNVTFRLDRGGEAMVQIFDLSGKLVYNRNYTQLVSGQNTVEFEAQNLVKGTYLIVVTQNNKRIGSGRFVKM
ncbi:MAG: hypothetical protein Fur0041_12160 [Bacteroidia bacterium]